MTWPIAILRIVVLGVKVFLVILFFMMVRWSWPRFRFDQLMALAWKVMLPLGLVNLIAIAVLLEYGPALATQWGVPRFGLIIAASWLVMVVSWIAMALAAPLTTDNTPRRDVSLWDSELELSD